MDLRFYVGLHILLFASCHLLSQAKGDEVQSVAFLDSSSHRFLRERPSTELGHETGEMLVDDISAAAAVLLGFAPPSPLSKTSSSKLNELLFPNPFNRPRAVLMVEVRGIEAPIDVKGGFSNDFRYNIRASAGEHITVPADEKDLAVIPVDEPLSSLDIEFSELAHLLGGSYVGTMEAMDGVLTLPLPSGSSLVLRVSEKSELHYASSLASLVHGIKKAAQMHEGFSGGVYNPAELLIGTFTGIEELAKYVEWSVNMLAEDGKRKLKNAKLQAKKECLRMWTNYVPPVSNSKAIQDQNFTGKISYGHNRNTSFTRRREGHVFCNKYFYFPFRTFRLLVSGDCVVVADDSVPFANSSAERRVNLSSIRTPKMGSPRREEKPAPYAREAREFLHSHLIGRQDKRLPMVLEQTIERRKFSFFQCILVYFGQGNKGWKSGACNTYNKLQVELKPGIAMFGPVEKPRIVEDGVKI